MKKIAYTLLTLLVGQAVGQPAVTPHALFSENAVLQQRMNVPVWGTAKEGERVTVEFQGQKLSTTTTAGRWKVVLQPLRAGGPFPLTISGENTITLTNIMVGEVWVACGQSNMYMSLGGCERSAEAIARASDPGLRLLTVPNITSSKPEHDLGVRWVECRSVNVGGYSAVAYYFGRDLRRDAKVPVGLISASWGASPAQAWTPHEALQENPELRVGILEADEAVVAKYFVELEQYKRAEPELKAKYESAVAQAKQEGKEPTVAPPTPPPDASAIGLRPSAMYNAMISPLQPFAIRGVIWYQGESNAGAARQYRTLFPAVIASWRKNWGQGDFPFLFVQLAPFQKIVTEPGESPYWAELREAQLFTSRTVPHTAMAVITDAGDENDVHPKRKEPVGARLAIAARALALGEPIEYSGPICRSMKIEGGRITLTFDHAAHGMVAKDGALKGFAITGDDRKYVSAQAAIDGNRVIVSSPRVPKPVAVRFGWADYPVVNLWNTEGLPASPFTTDDSQVVSQE